MQSQQIAKGLAFLGRSQNDDGSYNCLVSESYDHYDEKHTTVCSAIVPTNIVLSSLINIKNKDSEIIKKKSADFLLSQRNDFWSFNYWIKNSPESLVEPYPDDLDDTFCALSALYEYDQKIFTGEVLAKITTMLTLAELDEGGPYNMWLVPDSKDESWKDRDLVVNANIAYFLSLQDIQLPKLDSYIDTAITDRDFEFPYNTIYPSIYFISRFYIGEKTADLINLLLSEQDKSGAWENPMRTALAMSSLINLLQRLERLLPLSDNRITDLWNKTKRSLDLGSKYLINTQRKDGGWIASSFYYQMKTPERTLYAGSEYITTALCIEALHKYSNIMTDVIQVETTEQIFKDQVIRAVGGRFSLFDNKVKSKIDNLLDSIIYGYFGNEIIFISFRFLRACKFLKYQSKEREFQFTDAVFNLSIANVFGSLAYKIYDDILDEKFNTGLLPIANISNREAYGLLYATNRLLNIPNILDYIIDDMESANIWEIENCRFQYPDFSKDGSKNGGNALDKNGFIISLPDFGDFSQLARKSIAHVLGPLIIFLAQGIREDSQEFINLKKFFANYIIVRQLNDDMHDWEEDLKSGKFNSVSALILEDIKDNVSFDRAINDHNILRNVFWNHTVIRACDIIEDKIKLAENMVKELSVFVDRDFFNDLLKPLKDILIQTREKISETKSFVHAYSNLGANNI